MNRTKIASKNCLSVQLNIRSRNRFISYGQSKMWLIKASLVILSLRLVYGYRILGVFPTALRSHYQFGHALMKGLADDGNNVTMFTAFSQKNKSTLNYEEIVIENLIDDYSKSKCSDTACFQNRVNNFE